MHRMFDEQVRRAGITQRPVDQDAFRPVQQRRVALIPDAIMCQPIRRWMFRIHLQRFGDAFRAIVKRRAKIRRAVARRQRVLDDALRKSGDPENC